ncbi:homeobox-domain-containing protein [Macrolepiota fuliginosa MF-IS2]|uniref:Homeobox-domain-containing protein n=1 Tax=Macrolepiota fuliginosa MF-IS2 TaxID=1400762 RepID=A0A9P5XP64_9AGAR|nr:homeobox-domain-containing protein [Macrolepiota fuliginosa MF-IS2]
MSSSSKEQYYTTGSVGKSRRGSPGETNSVFFQGQGGRTVLPPISSAFPTSRFPVPSTYTTQYTQPRSSPSRFMLNQSAFYGQWTTGNNSPPLPESSFANYEAHDRYNTHASYTAYPSARTSPPIPQNPTDSRRLPPLSTTPAAGGERWQQGPYQISANYQTTSIRSPTASYPSAYAPYSTSTSAYTYLPATADQLDMNAGLFDIEPQVRSTSPYRSQLADNNFTPPPISPTSATEEPTIKKKRKRADANQLKVLNEVYARTAFPSTEERNALAKQLDMSPRSVQIWFQNKRQSMRQTNRQSTNTNTLSQQSFAMTSPGASHSSSRGLGSVGPAAEPSYIATSQDHARGHQSSSPHRRLQTQDEAMDPRKWSSRGF